jgi:hypothetical protein
LSNPTVCHWQAVFYFWPLAVGYWLKTDFAVTIVLRHAYRSCSFKSLAKSQQPIANS